MCETRQGWGGGIILAAVLSVHTVNVRKHDSYDRMPYHNKGHSTNILHPSAKALSFSAIKVIKTRNTNKSKQTKAHRKGDREQHRKLMNVPSQRMLDLSEASCHGGSQLFTAHSPQILGSTVWESRSSFNGSLADSDFSKIPHPFLPRSCFERWHSLDVNLQPAPWNEASLQKHF